MTWIFRNSAPVVGGAFVEARQKKVELPEMDVT
jgi:hypothetical protein